MAIVKESMSVSVNHTSEQDNNWSRIRRDAKARTLPPDRVFPYDPTSRGQNGPALSLRLCDLNPNEKRLFNIFPYEEEKVYSLKEMAELAFPELGPDKSYSYARNQLRRLIRGRLVVKVSLGTYKISALGKAVRVKEAH